MTIGTEIAAVGVSAKDRSADEAASASTSRELRAVYFPGLNALRFFAASAVIVHHLEQSKALSGYSSAWDNPFVQGIGKGGVALFFVLSGFLITYLLFVERERTGSVAIGKFYVRRILRILPLYFLVILGALFVLWRFVSVPEGFLDVRSDGIPPGLLALLLLVLPNVAVVLYPPVLGAAHTWSIGVEEQFYLAWPLVLRRYAHRLVEVLTVIIAVKLLVNLGQPFFWTESPPFGLSSPTWEGLRNTVRLTNDFAVEYMAMGALVATALYRRKNKLLDVLYHPLVRLAALACLPFVISLRGLPAHNVLEAVVYAVLILNVASGPMASPWLEAPVFRQLGRISYGIYMLHAAIIAIVLKFAGQHEILQGPAAFNLLLYLAVPVVTVSAAWISYRYFETPFLRLKKRHTVVRSGSTEEAAGASTAKAAPDQAPPARLGTAVS